MRVYVDRRSRRGEGEEWVSRKGVVESPPSSSFLLMFPACPTPSFSSLSLFSSFSRPINELLTKRWTCGHSSLLPSQSRYLSSSHASSGYADISPPFGWSPLMCEDTSNLESAFETSSNTLTHEKDEKTRLVVRSQSQIWAALMRITNLLIRNAIELEKIHNW